MHSLIHQLVHTGLSTLGPQDVTRHEILLHRESVYFKDGMVKVQKRDDCLG